MTPQPSRLIVTGHDFEELGRLECASDDLLLCICTLCSGLVVSCNAGLERSVQIACALNDSYGWGFKGRFNNDEVRKRHIYKIMMNEARRRGCHD